MDVNTLCSRAIVTLALVSAAAFAQQPVAIEMGVAPGLKFDPPRFHVQPGSKVSIEFVNSDQMMHNMVIAQPGARLRVLGESMKLGETGEALNFVPESPDILVSFSVLKPETRQTLTFTAPVEEGVYPYLCTVPGHGYTMYGAMYVSKERKMPALNKDPHLPPYYREASKNYHAYPPKLPAMYRIFMPDSGPASIAVALPGDISYCWDAGTCRLRYVWKGGFIRVMPHMAGNGNYFAGIVGRIFYRPPNAMPFRLGTKDIVPDCKFLGYRMVDNGFPEFEYRLTTPSPAGGATPGPNYEITVRELIKAHAGHSGIERQFSISGNRPDKLFFVTDPDSGGHVVSSAGKWYDEVLELSGDEAASFAITMMETPGKAPIGYWSMNDATSSGVGLRQDGAIGRAWKFSKNARIVTDINSDELKAGATISVWVSGGSRAEQSLLGARGKTASFDLLYSAGAKTVKLFHKKGEVEEATTARITDPQEWTHVAVVTGDGLATIYINGKRSVSQASKGIQVENARLIVGSQDKALTLNAHLDELSIHARMCSDEEIASSYSQRSRE